LGNILTRQNQPEEAIVAYREAIRRQPNDASAYYNLGVILYYQDQLKDAVRPLKRARDLYRVQGNIDKAEQVDQLIEQIDVLRKQPRTPVRTQ